MADQEPVRIGTSLAPVRAAIELVAAGHATRVTVYTPQAPMLVPAASLLAREAGVVVESSDRRAPEPELVVRPPWPRIA